MHILRLKNLRFKVAAATPGLVVCAALAVVASTACSSTRRVSNEGNGGDAGAAGAALGSESTSSVASGGSRGTSTGSGLVGSGGSSVGGGSGGTSSAGAGGDGNPSAGAGGMAGAPHIDMAPEPGGDGVLRIVSQSFTSVELSWEPALDDITPRAELEYRVYHSLADDIDTLEGIDENATALTGYSAGIQEATLAIEGGVDNYLALVVRDESGNRASYGMLEIPFAEAATCQVPGDCFSGTCRISYRDRDGDNYGVTTETTGRCDGSIPAGYAAAAGDCCDDGGNFGLAADIHPGQTEFFVAPAGICDVTWDYDCSDSVEVEQDTVLGACADNATPPECEQEVFSISEQDCGVRFYGCGCAVAGGSCTGVCAGMGWLMGCR